MKFRLANKEDLKDIIYIEGKCFPEAEAAKEEDIKKRFNAFKENFIVAVENDKIIGFINGCTNNNPSLPDELYHDTSLHNPKGDYQTVFGLDVLPEFRNKGVAGKLLKSFIELSKQRGKKGMVLTCKDHLVHYYKNFGFVNQGVSDSSHGGAKWNDMILFLD